MFEMVLTKVLFARLLALFVVLLLISLSSFGIFMAHTLRAVAPTHEQAEERDQPKGDSEAPEDEPDQELRDVEAECEGGEGDDEEEDGKHRVSLSLLWRL